MPRIVAVHGIGQQYKGPDSLHEEWFKPLSDGLKLAGVSLDLVPADLKCAFYGDLFRGKGTKSVPPPVHDESDVDEGDEQKLLEAWWREAAQVESHKVFGPDEATKGLASRVVQNALNALSHSKFFASIAESVEAWIIADLKQVTGYLNDPTIRRDVRASVEAVVRDDTRVLVGHSLGSVVAYECLCAHPEWKVKTLVTLGSPLGIRNLIFDKLEPRPEGLGKWPGSVEHWFNIAVDDDIVALVKSLKDRFGHRVEDRSIDNGSDAHSASRYLTAKETGDAIATGLR